eukprot:g11013.t1
MSAADPSVSATPSGQEAASADSSTPAPSEAPPDANESTVNGSDQPVADSHTQLEPPPETVATITPGDAGHESLGASSSGASGGTPQSSLLQYMARRMDKKQRDFADLRYVIWCCINLRPQQMRYDDGFKLFVGALSPQYVDTTMAPTTFNKVLDALYDRVKQATMDDLRLLREECLSMGYGGAFLGAQLDLTTVANEEYITFTISYVKKGDTDVNRVALATRAFPGSHTAEDVKPWIEALTLEYFKDLIGTSVQPRDVFLGFTVDQGKNIVNACTALGVPVVECNCHRVNSAVLWALGIAGSATTCKNKLMGDLMKKLAALVGVFSHSAVNNDMLKEIQRLEADLHRVYELIRRNDTRWTSQFRMMARLLILKKAINEYFRRLAQQNPQHKQLKRKLTAHEWTVTNEVCSLLDTVSEATIRMQGAADTHISQATFIVHEVIDMLREDSHPIRVENGVVTTPSPPAPGVIPTEEEEQQQQASLTAISMEDTHVTDLTQEAQDVVEVLLEVLEEKGVGKALQRVERLSVLLDPRRKKCDTDHVGNGSSVLRAKAEADLKAFIDHFEDGFDTVAPAPAPAANADADAAEPALKKPKSSSRLEARRAARVAATGGGNGTVSPQAGGTGRRVLIEREILVYLAEQPQLDVDGFNLIGFWNRRGTDSVCAATGQVTSPADMPYLAFIARLHLGIEATSCQAERNFSALAHLVGAAASGKDCNQVGAGPNESKAAKKREGIPVHAGDEGAEEEVSDIPASKSRKERVLCLGFSADGAGVVAKLESSIDQRTGATLADRSLWCGIPKFKAPGHLTLGKGTWEEDENGNLVHGYHNTNDREGKTPRCYANTIPVTMVGKEWRVPEWTLRYIRAGKVVQRNTNNQRHNGANKKARVKGNARK